MAQKIIFTDFFRIGSFPNLDKPYASKPNDTPKYGIVAMFPQNGITKPTGQATSKPDSIIAALNEVVQAEFGTDYATLLQYHQHYGIQYPPQFVDGNTKYMKDDKGNPLIGQVRPETMGMWLLSMKSPDPVDLVAPNGKENVTAAQMYAGCWARAEINVSAYTNKQNQRVLSIKLINLQLAFDDEKLASGGAATRPGTESFANMAVTNTNVQPAFNGIPAPTGIPGAMPAGVPGVPGVPQGMPQGMPAPGAALPGMAPGMAQAPGMPQGMPAGVPGAAPMMTPGAGMPQSMAPGAGMPQMTPPAGMPQGVPGQMMPHAVPGAAPMMAPPAPQAAPAPQVNTTDRVIMRQGELPLVQYRASGWSDEMLVQHGKADWNYNYVGG